MQHAIDSAMIDLGARLGGGWVPFFESYRADGAALRVVHRACDPDELVVIRNDRPPPREENTRRLGIDGFWYHSCWEDPALPGLRRVAEEYNHTQVLRYRPGKRITLLARDSGGNEVIIKCLRDDRARVIFQNHCAVYRARAHLEFDVSQPYLFNHEDFVLVQGWLPGDPVAHSGRTPDELADAMARAISSLHASRVRFAATFDAADQRKRSRRYAKVIAERFPECRPQVSALMSCLKTLEGSAEGTRYRPIHGSLHSHQWLDGGGRLALIDFDRAAMGHMELDVATYLAELDYEPGRRSDMQLDAFLSALPPLNERLLRFYRGHKHLAKAFKACKQASGEDGLSKVCRNLNRASSIVEAPR